ncbi:hypothetical protein DM01DRAFT_1320819 [Hesseltinella vesiculosa]|uniref:Ras-GAP domain-containing protein n=1 Tax=Hesseltinella vesiculosa TaxID=101127 RepID=A0A1X2GJR0_9FUNG|nr:hypothetical protein DM01DRAFT_1320819 [Hesseltinella vesiculosa]
MATDSKLIIGFINRIAYKLPINVVNANGQPLETLERDPVVQQTVAAVIEMARFKLSVVMNALGTVLENIAKHIPTSAPGTLQLPTDALQSQLFILRLMAACLQHNLKAQADVNVPRMDDGLAQYVMSLLLPFLALMHAQDETHESPANPFGPDRSSEPPNSPTPWRSSRSSDLVVDLYQVTGRILNLMSQSHWSLYYAKIKSVIQVMSLSMDSPDAKPPTDLRFLEFAHLDRQKLQLILSEISPGFLHMKTEGKIQFAIYLHKAIWRWIQTYPLQFNEVCVSETRILTGSEILFDLCSSSADNFRKKAAFWPLQTVLLILAPDLLLQAFLDDPTSKNRRASFLSMLRQSLHSPRTAEAAILCYVDLCKAATFVPPGDESVLRHIATDIEDELHEQIWTLAQLSHYNDDLTADHGSFLTDYLLIHLRLCSPASAQKRILSLMEDITPTPFKHALAKTCLLLVKGSNNLPWHPDLSAIYPQVTVPLCKLFIDTAMVENQTRLLVDNSSSSNFNNSRQYMSQSTSGRANGPAQTLLDLLELFKISPPIIMTSDTDDTMELISTMMSNMAGLCQHRTNTLRIAAADGITRLLQLDMIATWSDAPLLASSYWKITSRVMSVLARQVLDTKQQDDSITDQLALLCTLFEARHAFLTKHPDDVVVAMDCKERYKSSVAVEMSCLILLCSSIPEIHTKALQCLSLLCIEVQWIEEDDPSATRLATLRGNLPVYMEMVSVQDIPMIVGRKAQQKRIHKFLRMLHTPTPGIIAAWEEAWVRWQALTQVIHRFGDEVPEEESPGHRRTASTRHHDRTRAVGPTRPIPVSRMEIDDDKLTVWQNYMGFLVSLGGCCLKSNMLEDSQIMSGSSLPSISQNEPQVLIEKFVSDLLQCLIVDNVIMRESVKDALGHELAPPLYGMFSRQLEAMVSRNFNAKGEPIISTQRSLLLSQAMSVLRLILDRLSVGHSHFVINIDFGGLVSHFLTYIKNLTPSFETTRMKISFCYLVEAMVIKKDQIVIGNENRVRNRLLEAVMEWTSYISLSYDKVASPTRSTTAISEEKLFRDVDHVCIKTMIALSHQLPLQTLATNQEVDSYQQKVRLYTKYFNFITQVLHRCHHDARLPSRTTKAKDLAPDYTKDSYHDIQTLKNNAILIISNLLSANVDIGLKHTMTLGAYHEDPMTRTAFMQVLTNILYQGTEFDSLDENANVGRYEKLVDLMFESDMDIALSLCQVCPATELERAAKALSRCFFAKNHLCELLTHVMEKEVRGTDVESELFRGTTMATQLLSHTASMICSEYVRETLYPALVAVNALPEERLTWEVNPEKICTSESLTTNRRNVLAVADLLLKAICPSGSRMPMAYREYLAVLSDIVKGKFPEARYTAVGGFVFLRLFCPAMLTPEKHGFSPDALPKNRNAKKIILQANRIIQNLSSNVLFGSKDAYLVSLNDFLTENIYQVTTFLRELCAPIRATSPPIAATTAPKSALTHFILSSSPPASTTSSSSSSKGSPGPATTDQQRLHMLNNRTYELLHLVLYDNLDRISRDLSRRRTRTATNNSQHSSHISKKPKLVAAFDSSAVMNSAITFSSSPSSSLSSSSPPAPAYLTSSIMSPSPAPAANSSNTPTETTVARHGQSLPWKQTLDKLTKVLAELGHPDPIGVEQVSHGYNSAAMKSNNDYSEFMARHRHLDTSSVRALSAFYQAGTSRKGHPVFYLVTTKVSSHDINYELFIYHMLKVIEPSLNKPFHLVFDTTRMSVENEIPLHWTITFFQLIFNEMNEFLVYLHIFNPNTHLQRYIRKMPLKITNRLLKKTRFAISIADMNEFIAPSELQLPKASMDLEKEPCTLYNPVSKMLSANLRVPVMFRIGQEHVQVITVREQEIFFSLNTKLNDVFHVSEIVDIYPLPSSTTPGSGTELIIKHDNGKTSTVFSTNRRDAIVELFRKNKKKYLETASGDPYDRAIRPSDVPGRLLNMALMNLGDDDPNLRLASYNLLDTLSTFFRFEVSTKLLQVKSLCIPENDTDFIVSISKSLAKTQSHMTFDFIQECVDGFRRSKLKNRLLCLDYMAPWLKNLGMFVRNADHERGQAKVTEILRLLIGITFDSSKAYKHVQKCVWGTIAGVDELINPVLDIFTKVSVEKGLGSVEAETLGETLVTMGNYPIRAKIIHRIRRAIQRSSIRPTRSLPESPMWTEIAILLRFCLVLTFSTTHNMPGDNAKLPEACHVITLLVGTGTPLICMSVYELVTNILHNICSNRTLPEDARKRLMYIFGDVCDGDIRHHFGLLKTKTNAFTITQETKPTTMVWDTVNLASLEVVTRVLLEIMTLASCAQNDILNTWRARWMSLVTSTAFQFNPAIQPRSFVVLGCLAQDEVDDDLMYQILVSMRGAIAIFTDTDASLVTSIMMCLTNVIDSLPRSSQYLLPMFWLAIALVQMGHPSTYIPALRFLRAVIVALDSHKIFANRPMVEVLLDGRRPFEIVSQNLDRICGVSFQTHFSFAVTTLILKGAKGAAESRELIRDVLTTFFTIEAKHCQSAVTAPSPPRRAATTSPSIQPVMRPSNGSARSGTTSPPPAVRAITNSVTRSSFTSTSTSLALGNMTEQPSTTIDARLLGYLIGLLPYLAQDGASDLIELIGLSDVDLDMTPLQVRIFDTLDIPSNTTALLMVSMLVLVLNTLEADSERTFLYSFLSESALAVPEVFFLVYEALLPKMNQVFLSSQSQSTLDSVKQLLLNACAESATGHSLNRRSQKSYLDELGFSALTDPSFGGTQEHITTDMLNLLLDKITS